MKMNRKRVEDIKKTCQHKSTNQQEQAFVTKEKREKTLEEVKVKLENSSAEQGNEMLAEIDFMLDLEDIDQLEDQMSTTA